MITSINMIPPSLPLIPEQGAQTSVGLDQRVNLALAGSGNDALGQGAQATSVSPLAQTLDQAMRAFATQQFMETLMVGEPEETGMPTLSFDGDSDD